MITDYYSTTEDGRLVQKCNHCQYTSPTINSRKAEKISAGMIAHLRVAHHKDRLFDRAEFPIIKDVKESECSLVYVSDKIIHLNIDDKIVIVQQTPKGIKMMCPCDFCGKKGVANYTNCRRKIRAWMYLLQMNGRISEVNIDG